MSDDHRDVELTLTIDGVVHGWLDATLVRGGRRARLRASYLSDAPTQLVETITSLHTGEVAARCVWCLEPGSFEWTFERHGDAVRVLVVELRSDPYLPDPTEFGTIVFADELGLGELSAAVVDALDSARDRLGAAEYAEAWGYPYPEPQLARLRDRLTRQG